MRAGVAKVCITPPVGTWQGGYAARERPATGVHDELYARAIVFCEDSDEPGEGGGDSGDGQDGAVGARGATVAIVSMDVVALTPELSAATKALIAAQAGVPAENVALCASHTHGGPLLRPFLGVDAPQPDGDYLRLLPKYLAGAVAAAAKDLQPAAVRLAWRRSHFAVNRRLHTAQGTLMRPNPAGPMDPEVAVLRVDRLAPGAAEGAPDGHGEAHPGSDPGPLGTRADEGAHDEEDDPLAVLFRYTCHATARGASNHDLTADYPGAAAAFVEESLGGKTVALFLQGCAGDVRPHLAEADGAFRGASWGEVTRLGRNLGGAVVAATERDVAPSPPAPPDAGVVRAASTMVTLPFGPLEPEGELRGLAAAGTWPDGRQVTETERRWAQRTLEMVARGTVPVGVPAEVQVFRLGAAWLVVLPGEVFVEIGWRVREAVAAAAGVPTASIVVVAYANGSVGYVPTAAAIPLGGYEVTSYRGAGRPAPYAPEAEDVLARAVADLARGLR